MDTKLHFEILDQKKGPFEKGLFCVSWTPEKLPIFTSSKLILLRDAHKKNMSFCLFRWVPDHIIEIDYIATDPEHRRKGYAKLCLQELQKQCKPLKIWLEVSEKNKEASRFYETLGFVKEHVRNNYYADGEAAFLYTLSLQ